MPQQVALITGTSSGFGRLLVEKLAARGTIVYATMRRIESHQVLVDAIVGLIDTVPGARPLRTCVGIDMGARALNDATKDVGLNMLAALGLPHLQDVRTAAPAPAGLGA